MPSLPIIFTRHFLAHLFPGKIHKTIAGEVAICERAGLRSATEPGEVCAVAQRLTMQSILSGNSVANCSTCMPPKLPPTTAWSFSMPSTYSRGGGEPGLNEAALLVGDEPQG